MNKTFVVLLLFLLNHTLLFAQPTQDQLTAITTRGKLLAEYDTTAWAASDAVKASLPQEGLIERYIAQKTDKGWEVVFGRLNKAKNKFLVYYLFTQNNRNLKQYNPPQTDAEFYYKASKAIEMALDDFNKEPHDRSYNVAVLPSENNLWVYLYPAQIQEAVYPLGGDFRYLISGDTFNLLERRKLHNTILEFTKPPENVVESFHTAVLDDIPEDTDVFHVLIRKPSIAQTVATKNYIYKIEGDGSITYKTGVKTR